MNIYNIYEYRIFINKKNPTYLRDTFSITIKSAKVLKRTI